ncbi:MAG TPA: peptidoglycan bridge formation glycyltransferase FemA/FemB family protein [Candidatus Marinimicrobia bacterium]|nr:peptidoglycan bridge formation glycyltransferase FemA/FemB family protein [Candidatus Neomarinimicrobiota bacterium]HRS51665.1 peptidoglycan bridge formation glycyltransferase FemA/FemB family protein [Candidatus Neomarinimicrobiota bacterium]HRU92185.1 peptidoglycan bridge formation glycyltransferase FemA/FemB family protein [Candidatus Neomarinimicrobiota bacterium]
MPKEYENIAYNNFIAESRYSSIYQSFEWGIIREFDNWEVIRLIAIDSDRFVGALSCLCKKSPLFGKRIFYIPRGPVLDYSAENAHDIFDSLFIKIREIARRDNALYIRISPDIRKNACFNDYISKYNLHHVRYPILHTTTYRLDLTKTEEQLLNSMESRVKYDIRKAQRDNVEILSDDGNEEYLKKFYNLLYKVADRNKFPIYSYEMMQNIWNVLSPKGMCKIFLARIEGEIVSGAFLFLFGDKCIYQWGGSVKTKINPNQLLHWKIIQWAKSKGVRIYDLQGIPENVKKGDDLWGIYLFKRGFGGERVQLVGEYDNILSPALYKTWQVIEPKYPAVKNYLSKIRKGK